MNKILKLIKEEIELTESAPKAFSNEFASWFTGTVLNDVEHPEYGKHKVTPQQIKHSPGEYKNALYQAMKRAIDDGDITPDMIKEGSLIKDNVLSEDVTVFDERHFGKNGIIIMIDDNGKKYSAIFKDKHNANKYNRNDEDDIHTLLKLAKETPYPNAIDEGINESKEIILKPTGKSDYWDRPIYVDDRGRKYVDVNLGDKEEIAIHTTSRDGEPDTPVKNFTIKESLNESKHRPIYQIAGEISDDWGRQVNFAAKPYLQAMFSLDSIDDKYILDSGRDIVSRFLANAGTWRGDTAKRIKKELKNILKGKRNENTVLERKKLKLERLIKEEIAIATKKMNESATQTKTISKQIEEFKSNEQRIEEINESIKDSLDKLKELQTSNKNLLKRIKSGMSTLELKVVKASKWVAKLETVAKYKRPTPNYSELWKEALGKVNKETRAVLVAAKDTQLELKGKETKQQLTIESGISDFWRNLVNKFKNLFSAIKNFSRTVDELPEIDENM